MMSSKTETDDCFDVLIVGGGVVGLSILRSATLAGYKCVLVEAHADLLTEASGNNSGIACTGVDAAPGTLERALIRDSISQLRPFLKQSNIPHRPCGSLVCQWSWDNDSSNVETTTTQDRLEQVLAESHEAGDTHATRLNPTQVQEMEPNLADSCQGGVHIPGEIVLDPWLYSISLAVQAREHGATIHNNFSFDGKVSSWNSETQIWTVSRCNTLNDDDDDSLEDNEIPKTLYAKCIVNAAGIHADVVQDSVTEHLVDPPHWKAQPRRGQYRIFQSTDTSCIQHPIQPVPTQRTKGVFVFSTLYNQIVVGPTALDQESRNDVSIDANVATQLTETATRILPTLNATQEHVGEYVGIRPGTNHRDYQIRLYPKQHWIVAAGIRSTGLTASLGIGRHVVHLLEMVLGSPKSMSLQNNVQSTPLPPIQELVKDYHDRGDGRVMIHGHVYRVTHPITRLGWNAKTGIASVQ